MRDADDAYDADTGQITTVAFPSAPAAGEEMELWVEPDARALSPMPTRIERAINRARDRLVYEDTWLFVTNQEHTRYPLPHAIKPGSIKNVELARGNYPDIPAWDDAPHWDLTAEGNVVSLDFARSRVGGSYSEAVARVTYIRTPEPFGDLVPEWFVDQEWAGPRGVRPFPVAAREAGDGLEHRGRLPHRLVEALPAGRLADRAGAVAPQAGDSRQISSVGSRP